MLRAYIVQEFDDPEGLAVIAETAKEAKKLAFGTGDFPCEWIELRVQWIREANVEGLQKGVMSDCLDALRRGIFSFVEDHPCDKCGHIGHLQEYKGCALCYHCYEED